MYLTADSGVTHLNTGMYNVPSFTLARTIGGILAWYWRSIARRDDTKLIVLASVSSALEILSRVAIPDD